MVRRKTVRRRRGGNPNDGRGSPPALPSALPEASYEPSPKVVKKELVRLPSGKVAETLKQLEKRGGKKKRSKTKRRT